jgi:hypothetical protein
MFAIFTVCVTGVLSACDPKVSVLGVAERLADPGTGVGVGLGLAPGVGVGLGELLAALAPPPQPIALAIQIVRARKKLKWMVGFILLRTATPHRGFQKRICIWIQSSAHHFITST